MLHKDQLCNLSNEISYSSPLLIERGEFHAITCAMKCDDVMNFSEAFSKHKLCGEEAQTIFGTHKVPSHKTAAKHIVYHNKLSGDDVLERFRLSLVRVNLL